MTVVRAEFRRELVQGVDCIRNGPEGLLGVVVCQLFMIAADAVADLFEFLPVAAF